MRDIIIINIQLVPILKEFIFKLGRYLSNKNYVIEIYTFKTTLTENYSIIADPVRM